jgi:hypothetical protein
MDEKSYISVNVIYRLKIRDRLKDLGLGLRYIENYISENKNIIVFEAYPLNSDFLSIANFYLTIDSSDKSREKSEYKYEVAINDVRAFNKKPWEWQRDLLDILYDIASTAKSAFGESDEN